MPFLFDKEYPEGCRLTSMRFTREYFREYAEAMDEVETVLRDRTECLGLHEPELGPGGDDGRDITHWPAHRHTHVVEEQDLACMILIHLCTVYGESERLQGRDTVS